MAVPLADVPPPPAETGNAIVDGLAVRKWEKEHGVRVKAWKLAQEATAAPADDGNDEPDAEEEEENADDDDDGRARAESAQLSFADGDVFGKKRGSTQDAVEFANPLARGNPTARAPAATANPMAKATANPMARDVMANPMMARLKQQAGRNVAKPKLPPADTGRLASVSASGGNFAQRRL